MVCDTQANSGEKILDSDPNRVIFTSIVTQTAMPMGTMMSNPMSFSPGTSDVVDIPVAQLAGASIGSVFALGGVAFIIFFIISKRRKAAIEL
jgi:hypothetical protein